MSTETMTAIEALLRDRPQEFEFFQLVRLLAQLEPDREPVGCFVSPSKEVARFTANPASAFPASQVQSVEWPETGQPKVTV
ncbi:MAG TPA: type VI secretion system baseplate subunit TssG, partial [Solibacterales bacterium]|nr:type VI secretion system baseplate subunit TssG [Bryobacterales bacterium]